MTRVLSSYQKCDVSLVDHIAVRRLFLSEGSRRTG